MRSKLLLISVILSMTCCTASYANWYQAIINAIIKQAGVTDGILNTQVSIQKDSLTQEKDIDSLMKELNTNMTSHSGWGDYQSHDYQSYGESARDWSGVMQMAQSGQGNGELGSVINGIAKQFPAQTDVYNNGVMDQTNERYYSIKSQTVLAARAASQLDYNKIQDQIAYQHMLQQQIEHTKDLKSAMDLSNRIQVEGNLINLEILRQVSLSNQQQAVTEQASINTALSNAKFLTKE